MIGLTEYAQPPNLEDKKLRYWVDVLLALPEAIANPGQFTDQDEVAFDAAELFAGYVPPIEDAIFWSHSFFGDGTLTVPDILTEGLQSIAKSEPNEEPYFFENRHIELARLVIEKGTLPDGLDPVERHSFLMSCSKAGVEQRFRDVNDSPLAAALNLDPSRQEWFAALIRIAISDVKKYEQHLMGERVADWESLSHEESLREGVKCLRAGFAIGVLYRDAWWKREHEAKAIQKIEEIANLKEISYKGAQWKVDQKKERYRILNKLVSTESDFGKKRDLDKAKLARKLALRHDRDFQKVDEKMFFHQGRQLSLQWFKEWLTEEYYKQ